MIQKILWIAMGIILLAGLGYGQDVQGLLGQAAQIYTGADVSGKNLIGGFSPWSLMGGILFGAIGFIAFVYGKKNAELKPMIIGILLMGYPYLIRDTLALYLVGIALTAALYFFRE